MSRKRDAVYDNYYAPFLTGGNFNQNPGIHRVRAIESMYTRVLSELSMNRFKWYGLPKSIDPRFLELTLYRYALSVFYYDEDYGQFHAMQGTPSGYQNFQHNPTSFTVTGPNFAGKTLSAVPRRMKVRGSEVRVSARCVPIWANYLRTPDAVDIVPIYASRLADLDRTIEINAHNARRSKVLIADDNTRLSSVNINRQIDEGSPLIQVSAMGAQTLPQAIDMGVDPESIEKLDILFVRQWNRALGLLGINGANQDKKERLVSDEVSANDDQVDSAKNVALNARKQAAQNINDRWGFNISVEYNTDIEKQLNAFMDQAGVTEIMDRVGANA